MIFENFRILEILWLDPSLTRKGFSIFEKFHEIPIDMAGMFLYPIHTKENTVHVWKHHQDNQKEVEPGQTFT